MRCLLVCALLALITLQSADALSCYVCGNPPSYCNTPGNTEICNTAENQCVKSVNDLTGIPSYLGCQSSCASGSGATMYCCTGDLCNAATSTTAGLLIIALARFL